MKAERWLASGLVIASLACWGEAEPPPPAEPPAEPPVAQEPPEPAVQVAYPNAQGVVRIEVGDQIRFSAGRIEVPAGSTVQIELVHTGKLPALAMGHNLVVLRPGADLTALALDAARARDRSFIPAGYEADILAHTELIGGGERSQIAFEAPPPGTYTFVCTFPGHFAVMQGELVVVPPQEPSSA